jgi:hypothetical protein
MKAKEANRRSFILLAFVGYAPKELPPHCATWSLTCASCYFFVFFYSFLIS